MAAFRCKEDLKWCHIVAKKECRGSGAVILVIAVQIQRIDEVSLPW